MRFKLYEMSLSGGRTMYFAFDTHRSELHTIGIDRDIAERMVAAYERDQRNAPGLPVEAFRRTPTETPPRRPKGVRRYVPVVAVPLKTGLSILVGVLDRDIGLVRVCSNQPATYAIVLANTMNENPTLPEVFAYQALPDHRVVPIPEDEKGVT